MTSVPRLVCDKPPLHTLPLPSLAEIQAPSRCSVISAGNVFGRVSVNVHAVSKRFRQLKKLMQGLITGGVVADAAGGGDLANGAPPANNVDYSNVSAWTHIQQHTAPPPDSLHHQMVCAVSVPSSSFLCQCACWSLRSNEPVLSLHNLNYVRSTCWFFPLCHVAHDMLHKACAWCVTCDLHMTVLLLHEHASWRQYALLETDYKISKTAFFNVTVIICDHDHRHHLHQTIKGEANC